MPDADVSPIAALVAEATRLARMCRTGEARDLLDRAQRLLSPASPVSERAALTLALSFCQFFEAQLELAIATLGQARALAAATGDTEIEADCDATLALYHTRSGNMDETVRLARRALSLASPANATVGYRAHVALATVMQVAGLPEAFAEYRKAREYARQDNDDIAVAAAFHRMAVAQAIEARMRFESGTLVEGDARQAIVGLRSSLDMMAGVAPSATQVVDGLMLAQLHLMLGELDAAAALYDEHLPQARAQGHGPIMASAFAECALCQALRGRLGDARTLLDEALASAAATDDPMRHALLYRAAEATYAQLGEHEPQKHYDALARAAWDEFRAAQERWRRLLNTN